MGFFKKEEASDAPTQATPATPPTPVTLERIADTLAKEDIHFDRDQEEEMLLSFWSDMTARFFLRGDENKLLVIDAYWKKRIPAELRERVLEVANDWSREAVFPKPWIGTTDTGDAYVIGEVNVDCSFGLTDEQLKFWLLTGMGSSSHMFEKFDSEFPQAVALRDD